ncbi:hypothetical protein [Qipengyuania sp.]|uniref:hypothetical protein n=1 Tax=Qipengyuania sp. TaxID=2004515 RepID=UPI0035C78EE5
MKLSRLSEVSAMQMRMRRIEDALAATELGYIAVSLGGKGQDDGLTAVLRAPILTELKARKAAVVRELHELGVEVD